MSTDQRRIPIVMKQWLALVAVLVMLPWVGNATAAPTLDQQLIEAARSSDVAAVKSLLDKGADVNPKDKDGATPLMVAVQQGHLTVVNVLLARGADVNGKI